MGSYGMAMTFTFCFMALLVSAHIGLAMNVEEDVAAIPPTPMESQAVALGAPVALSAFVFLVWFM